ncbi:hypothetical protein Rhe02_22700 [Rhizocola hellebori]|uniref:Uncharacterized protein n=1 Tax=Rhizocola hellebori TaxID=1392758 RepID=A0A8J3Q571_9ACTN|nr:hypothetical protein Rhe02_22700 [Rhizocola hellebori]
MQLPRWVVAAASAAQHDLPYRTNIEVESGLIASARGRDTGNAFLAEVASDTLRIFDDRSLAGAIDLTDRDAGIAAVLDLVRSVNEILDAHVDNGDAMAFRRWLLTITDVVISAARSGDILGFGGKLITESEQSFRDRLAVVLKVA